MEYVSKSTGKTPFALDEPLFLSCLSPSSTKDRYFTKGHHGGEPDHFRLSHRKLTLDKESDLKEQVGQLTIEVNIMEKIVDSSSSECIESSSKGI